jgi:hypothetical protein
MGTLGNVKNAKRRTPRPREKDALSITVTTIRNGRTFRIGYRQERSIHKRNAGKIVIRQQTLFGWESILIVGQPLISLTMHYDMGRSNDIHALFAERKRMHITQITTGRLTLFGYARNITKKLI